MRSRGGGGNSPRSSSRPMRRRTAARSGAVKPLVSSARPARSARRRCKPSTTAFGSGAARESPEDAAHLLLAVHGQAMVDTEHPAVGGGQDVRRLAVGIVDDQIEAGQRRQPLVVGVGEHERVAILVPGAQHRKPTGRQLLGRQQIDQFVVVGGVHPLLHHAGTERPVAEQRRRHTVPAGGRGDPVRGDLAIGEGAVREVPQRPFAADRLVDALDRPGRPVRRCRPG